MTTRMPPSREGASGIGPHDLPAPIGRYARPAAPARCRLGELDLLRFVAAMLVVAYHLSFVEWLSPTSLGAQLFVRAIPVPAWLGWNWCGWIGVQIFFLISGFVMAYSAGAITAREFVRGRVLRLWPCMLVASTASLALYLMWHLRAPGNIPWLYAKELLFVPFGPWLNGVVWTLGIEVVFYLLVLLLIQQRRIAYLGRLAAGLAIWSLAYHVVVWWPDAAAGGALAAVRALLLRFPRLSELLLLNHGGYFALGIYSYLLFVRRATARDLLPGLLALVACALQIVRTFVWETMEHRRFGLEVFGASVWLPLGLWAAALAMMLWLAIRGPGAAAWLGSTIVRQLGDMTYPLYLLHTTVGLWTLATLARQDVPPAACVTLALTASITFAWLVSRQVEPRIRRAVAAAFDAWTPAGPPATRSGSHAMQESAP